LPRLDLPPTKTSYLRVKSELGVAREGYTLLDEKRQILVMELMARLELARRTQREVQETFKKLYEILFRALLRNGSAEMEAEASAVRIEHDVAITENRIAGLDLPRVTVEVAEPGLQFGLGARRAASDEVLKAFAGVLPLVARLAEVETAVIRLAGELKKTQRRVNALEKIFIPDYEETIKYITSTLEEREREEFVVLKAIKTRRNMGD